MNARKVNKAVKDLINYYIPEAYTLIWIKINKARENKLNREKS